MLVLLMGLSIIKAALIIAYFMHLRYEKPSMALTLMPALVIVIVLMNIFLPDSLRLLHMRPH
jgi:caa(3)-type oxidase subunit IV